MLIPLSGNSQSYDKKAIEFYYKGCDKVAGEKYREAIADFSTAIGRDSGFIQAYVNRGVARFYLKDYECAIDDYDKALSINPQNYNTYGRRGWAKFYLHDYPGAISDFTRTINGSREPSKYYNIRGYLKYRLKDYKGAIDDFNAEIRTWSGSKPGKSRAYYWRGLVRIDTGDNVNGCSDLKKALDLGYTEAQAAIIKYCTR